MALIEPERCIAHMVRGPNKGRRCTKKGRYRPNYYPYWSVKGKKVLVCKAHFRGVAWQRDVVERFYLGRYWE